MPVKYECAICGRSSEDRAEFVEFRDPVKLGSVVERAKRRGRVIKEEEVKFVCYKCSTEMYSEETRGPKSVRVTCPRCGEVIEVWL